MKVCSVCQRCYDDSAVSCSEENHEFLTEARAGSCEIVPNYRLEFLHETGRESETYRAVNTILKKPYFIKIIAPDAFDEAAKKRFLSEAQTLAAVIHPNVARVFESGALTDGSLYVVTESFTAQTLRECLENVGAPSEVTALTITRQAAEGLEAIHASGVLHGNIRPENLILTADAENRFLVKLQNIDFGSIHQNRVIAEPEQNIGDLRYFSPEQCAAQETDAQTDVYSLGVVLYETLAGSVPFDAPYADALIKKQINETPPPVKINSFDIRMLLTHTLTDALQKQARTRLKSANAFARRIRHIEQLATHSSTPPPVMSYPATMNKTAVVFTPPAKAEKTEAPLPVKAETIFEAPVLTEIRPAAEESLLAENPLMVEELPVIENASMVEELPLNETPAIEENAAVEARPVVEELAAAESPTIIEEPPPAEIPAMFESAADEAPAVVEELSLIETPVIAESLLADEIPPVVEDLPLIDHQPIGENPPAVEMQTVAEEPVAVEAQMAVEDLLPVEDLLTVENVLTAEELIPVETAPEVVELAPVEKPAAVDESPFTESEPVVENTAAVEAPSVVEDVAMFEAEANVESSPAVEHYAFIESPPVVENQPVVEDASPVEMQTAVEDAAPVEVQITTENPVAPESQPVVEDVAPVEILTAAEDSVSVEAGPVSEEVAPVEIQTAAEESETPAPVFIDLTTTKLPPLETVVKKTLPENIVITEIEPIFSLKDGFLDIHKTSEPVLVEWEQPDDVPTTTQALKTGRKELADARFAAETDFDDDGDYIFEAGDVDSPRDSDSEDSEPRRNYAAEREVFSYDDSGTTWNLPDNRKILTGAGLLALLVLAVGGTLLGRQFLTARDARQTTAQSSPNVKTLPKAAEPEKVSETDKSLTAKPENASVSNASSESDENNVPELPNYQPRETDVKTVVSTLPETRSKKRVLKEAVEKLEQTTPAKNASAEVFDKKGNIKSSPDNKTPVKNQASTSTKTGDIFTRPRIVKNPQF